MDGKRQPYDAAAEQSVLGSVLIEPKCLAEAVELVNADDFYIPENRNIFTTLWDMFLQGKTVDPVLLLQELKSRELYDEAGGRAYIAELMRATPTWVNMPAYAAVVRDKAKLRKLVAMTDETCERASQEAGEAEALVETLEQQLYELHGDRTRSGLVPIKEALAENLDHMNELAKNKGRIPGLPTGFSDLDKYITGLNDTELILLAARPSVGKSAIALNIARNAARSGKSVVVFNLEMGRVQLVQRLLSSEGMIDMQKLKLADLEEEEWDRLVRATSTLSELPIYLDDTANISVAEIKARCRRVPELGLVIIDYLQLVRGNRKDGNRVLEVGDISRAMKIMAKELKIPVLCLSQLSRASEQRDDKRPRLSDLRDSGAIEQDADIVMFLHRDDKPNPDESNKNEVECIIAKNRSGATGTIKFRWMGQYTRFAGEEKNYGKTN